MTKGLWVYCPSPMFSKTCTILYFYILSHLLIFSSFSFFLFFPSLQPHFHKSYPQSKTFVNMRAVPNSAVFCSNIVLITTPSSFMQFFSFFDMLPSAPTTTGMTLMLLIFHILLFLSLVPGIS